MEYDKNEMAKPFFQINKHCIEAVKHYQESNRQNADLIMDSIANIIEICGDSIEDILEGSYGLSEEKKNPDLPF